LIPWIAQAEFCSQFYYVVVIVVFVPALEGNKRRRAPLERKKMECKSIFYAQAFSTVFKEFNVPERTEYLIIKQSSARTRHKSNITETRGRKRKITKAQIEEADRILQDEDLQLEGK
jgi:hypothetical protein